jgi:acylphosphatase
MHLASIYLCHYTFLAQRICGKRGLKLSTEDGLLKLPGRKTMANIRVRLIIEGRVQGVWFRDSTRREAVGLGVSGWVKNRRDGGVEVLAEGPENRVKKLVAWCHQGPSYARVTQVHETWEEWQGEFDSFDIVF